jgi:2-desacetyl-2-hydroxyethyl bacteriochlorophyllide A dehydrogenase
MRAVAIISGRPEVVERAIPEIGLTDVLVEVERCGICGTDLHMPHRPEAEGLVPGHEIGGRVARLGPGATGLRRGQRVAVLPSARCGHCGPCRRDEVQLCLNQWSVALGFGRDGGYAEYVAVPASSCFVIPESMTAAQAALVEPYSVALHGVNLGSPRAGDSAVVVGAGPIGLLAVAALIGKGITDVTVVEPKQARADAALRLGAAKVVQDVADVPDGESGDCSVVLECSGVRGLVQEAIRVARPGGTVVVLGVPAEGELVSLVPRPWLRKEVGLKPSIWYTIRDFEEARAQLESGAVPTDVLGVAVRPLDQVAETFATIRTSELIKVQLDPTLR